MMIRRKEQIEKPRKFNFHGRKKGKRLSPLQAKYIKEYLPTISVTNTEFFRERKQLNFSNYFESDCPIYLEVGFGGGEHLVELAKENRHVGILGCEPYINGVAKLLPKLIEFDLTNVRVLMDDARNLLELIPDAGISKIFLLFPDPWPKARHHRRRFINVENIEVMAKILKPGGLIFLATDVKDYVRHSLEHMVNSEHFSWLAEKPSDWRHPWLNWSSTRYQVKTQRLGRPTTYLIFRRN